MGPVRRFWLVLLSALVLGGCDPADNDEGDSGAGGTSTTGEVVETSSSAGNTATTSASADETGAGASCLDEKIGIPECDRYLQDYLVCIEEAIPKDDQMASLDALETTCEGWREAAQTDAGAKALYETCTSAWLEAAKTCGWSIGSCEGACETPDAVPDGMSGCYCAAGCIDLGDCCDDYEEVCKSGQGATGSEDLLVAQLPVGDWRWNDAQWRWPSTRHYPDLAPALLPALETGDGIAILVGLEESFATTKWSSLRDWDRFGAVELERGFISADDGERQDGFSLGCMGGMVEAARLLAAPHLAIEQLLAPLDQCPFGDSQEPCFNEAHTGLHVLAHLRADQLPTWQLNLVEHQDTNSLRTHFELSDDPYFVSASHVSRRDGARRFHHMLVVFVDEAATVQGPVVFDVTGLGGVSARRMSWRRLARYLGGALADSRDFRYAEHSTTLAVLHSG